MTGAAKRTPAERARAATEKPAAERAERERRDPPYPSGWWGSDPGDWLSCQNCGHPLRFLTDADKQRVADRPYDFVAFCPPCAEDELEKLRSGSGPY